MSSGEQDLDFVVLGDQDIVNFNAAGLLPQSTKCLQLIQQWLKPTACDAESSEYRKHLASCTPSTGKWVLKEDDYQKWFHGSDHGALLVKGVAASVIAAKLISQLASISSTPVLYFFFRQIITTKQTPQSLVRGWMSQLLQYSPLLQSKLENLLDSRRNLDSLAVTRSSRPLRLLKIATIVDLARENSCFGLASTDSFPGNTKSAIRNGCGPLLEILEGETVSIIHHSLTGFLLDSETEKTSIAITSTLSFPRISPAKTHESLATICIQYLLSDWHNDWKKPTSRKANEDLSRLEILRIKYPFLGYAINNWRYHIRQSEREDHSVFLLLDKPLEKNSTLFLAAKHGQSLCASVLLNNNAATDLGDSDGFTPLHLAAQDDHYDVVQMLLNSGIDPCMQLLLDAGAGIKTYPTIISQYYESRNPTHHREAESKLFHTFIKRQESRHSTKKHGTEDFLKAFKMLLEAGCDVNSFSRGATVLHRFLAHPLDCQIIKLLLSNGADSSLRDSFGRTALHFAGRDSHNFDLLVANRADIDFCDANGRTPIFNVVCGLDALSFLKHNPDCNARDKDGDTPLHIAIRSNLGVATIKALLDPGADVNMQNKREILHCMSSLAFTTKKSSLFYSWQERT
ncbi:hypothetical protein G7Y89_g11952 [Cudoniella acicularis]|uniref:Nephrocystin 3-like N-terminal domain-containing protein n=1 Tax=Cudoniella acicularis TaxID=354080 RepID=A0A8H4R9U9_9HELO|nr:hypothetical protein G7Y89_g11952 [Cudoniella acicularis]